MYHSVIFFKDLSNLTAEVKDEINTWDDWHLIPSTRPVISPPSVRTNYIDIPGRNGSLDLSEVLTGYPLYQDRSGSLKFYVMHDYWVDDQGNNQWQETYRTIAEYLHGQRLYMQLEDDKSYYYEGRFALDNWTSDEHYSTITIKYVLEPFKWKTECGTDWLWDYINFSVHSDEDEEDDSIVEFTLTSGSTAEYSTSEYTTPRIVMITVSDVTDDEGNSLTDYTNTVALLIRDGETVGYLALGENTFRGLIYNRGASDWKIALASGIAGATITMSYREGSL